MADDCKEVWDMSDEELITEFEAAVRSEGGDPTEACQRYEAAGEELLRRLHNGR